MNQSTVTISQSGRVQVEMEATAPAGGLRQSLLVFLHFNYSVRRRFVHLLSPRPSESFATAFFNAEHINRFYARNKINLIMPWLADGHSVKMIFCNANTNTPF